MEEKDGHSMVEGSCCSSLDSNNMGYNQEFAEAADAVGCYGKKLV